MMMAMRVAAVLSEAHGLWLAECEDVDRSGEGRTPEEAIDSLREALKEYFGVEAVAPPSNAAADPIEIVIVDATAGVPTPR